MYKQPPSRNNRSKGIKVKHILQICVLVAVCFWLLYQVKHSHEKRKEFESADEKVVKNVRSDSEIQRFGRKDIPRITEITKSGENHDDDDDEDKDGEEEENKHEKDELEQEVSRVTEKDDERGGGDDEIDEHELEKTEEEEVDEEKAREDKESDTEENHEENKESEDTHEEGHPEEVENDESGKEDHTELEENGDVDKEDHGEQEGALDDQDHDSERNTRQAQEELYKADDASSEVAHNVQLVDQETENATMSHGREIYGKINVGLESEIKSSNNSDELIQEVLTKDVDSAASNATITEQKIGEVNTTKPDDSSIQNATLPEITSNSTVTDGELSATSLSNGTQIAFDSNSSQNVSVALKPTDDKNQQETAETAIRTENVPNTNTTLSSFDALNGKNATESAKEDSIGDVSEVVKSEDTEKDDSNENSDSHTNENIDATQQDAIDASDTNTLIQDEKESRIDLDTLPEIKSEVHNTEDSAAE
ncbi:unnamed protein product [Amaranthus hypochondriacus]